MTATAIRALHKTICRVDTTECDAEFIRMITLMVRSIESSDQATDQALADLERSIRVLKTDVSDTTLGAVETACRRVMRTIR